MTDAALATKFMCVAKAKLGRIPLAICRSIESIAKVEASEYVAAASESYHGEEG